MAGSKLDLYVGCSLTQAPDEFKDSVEDFKDRLRDTYDIFDFVGLVEGTSQDVYRWDIGHCVGGCAMLVAVCDYPSIGLGYEMATAIEKQQTSTLAVAHTDAQVTRLVQGIDAPHFAFRRYGELAEVVDMVHEEVERNGLQVVERPELTILEGIEAAS